jgi:hypothetical protein
MVFTETACNNSPTAQFNDAARLFLGSARASRALFGASPKRCAHGQRGETNEL